MAEVTYTESIDIEAPPETVYEHRLDFTTLTEVNPNVTNLVRTDAGSEPGVGASYSFDTTIPDMGTIPTTLTVIATDPPKRIVNEMDAGLRARETTTFEPTPSGTRVTFEVTIFAPDEIDDAGRAFIIDSGSTQVRLELESMKRILEA
jgi:uncharacterized protein YndB with AHSA1/START domain